MSCDRQLIFDVGVHRGEDSAYYLALGYRVVGFEANPALLDHCRRRFASELRTGQLILIPGAITARSDTTVTFYQHSHAMLGTINAEWVERNRDLGESACIEVSAVDFGACLGEYGVPYYMKIDIEGADRVCLGALHAAAGRPQYVSLESEKADFKALVEEFDILCDLGFDRFAVVQQAGISRIENATRLDGSALTYSFEPDTSGPFGPDVGPWLTRDQAITRYRRIFKMYRLVGDHSWARRTRVRRTILIRTGHILRLPLPGWYDTHAMRRDP